jgi:hypothetical protein
MKIARNRGAGRRKFNRIEPFARILGAGLAPLARLQRRIYWQVRTRNLSLKSADKIPIPNENNSSNHEPAQRVETVSMIVFRPWATGLGNSLCKVEVRAIRFH